MSSPERDWVLDQVASVVDAQPTDHPLRRVDRDNSRIYEGSQTVDMSTPTRSRQGELREANFVGASWADRSREAIGSEYDYRVENVVAVRVEGLHHTKYGHIDPDGDEGVSFTTLVDDLIDAIDDAATNPGVSGALGAYKDLFIVNESPALAAWSDAYRYDFDVLFSGFEARS